MCKPVDKDKKILFSLPYIDQHLLFWENLAKQHSSHISEIYFPLMDDQIGSGRPQQPQDHLVDFLSSKILPVSLLINPVVLPQQVGKLAGQIMKKIEQYLKTYNLQGITLTSLPLAKLIRQHFPELKLTASTLMEICNRQQLSMIEDVFDIIVPSNRLLRDLAGLEKLRNAFYGRIRLLVNESCLPSCVFRTQHFYEMSNPAIEYPCSLCNDLLNHKPWLRLIGNWVLPQHVYLFDGLYDELKLSGRISLQNPKRYLEVVRAYINRNDVLPHTIGGGPAAVHMPIEIDLEFYKHTLHCDKNCNTCTFCSDYWQQKVMTNG